MRKIDFFSKTVKIVKNQFPQFFGQNIKKTIGPIKKIDATKNILNNPKNSFFVSRTYSNFNLMAILRIAKNSKFSFVGF